MFLARALDRVEPVEKPDCERDSGPEDRLAQPDLPCRVFPRRGVTGVIFFSRIVSHRVLLHLPLNFTERSSSRIYHDITPDCPLPGSWHSFRCGNTTARLALKRTGYFSRLIRKVACPPSLPSVLPAAAKPFPGPRLKPLARPPCREIQSRPVPEPAFPTPRSLLPSK